MHVNANFPIKKLKDNIEYGKEFFDSKQARFRLKKIKN